MTLNKNFIELLTQIQTIKSKDGNFFRAKAYEKAKDAIITYNKPITSIDDIREIPNIGKAIDAIIELREIYFETNKVKKNTATAPNVCVGIIYKWTPSPVATPLPPLNFKKNEKRWPRKTIMPAPATVKGSFETNDTIATPSHPLNVSPKRVKAPAFLPINLATLVAPIFLLPCARRSIF